MSLSVSTVKSETRRALARLSQRFPKLERSPVRDR